MEWAGKVETIASVASMYSRYHGGNTKTFEVEIALETVDDKMKSGMSCETKILTDTIEDVLYVPINAVFKHDERDVCYVYAAPEIVSTPVVTGAKGELYIEIKEGLSEGDEVLLYETEPARVIEPAEEPAKPEAPAEPPAESPEGESAEAPAETTEGADEAPEAEGEKESASAGEEAKTEVEAEASADEAVESAPEEKKSEIEKAPESESNESAASDDSASKDDASDAKDSGESVTAETAASGESS
jgi:hypothetical protein